MGAVYRHGAGKIAKNLALGSQYLRKGCRLGHQLSCHEVAASMLVGKFGESTRPKEAIKMLEQSCSLDSYGQSYFTAGASKLNGIGQRKDLKSGWTLIKRACDLGNAAACRALKLATKPKRWEP